MKKFLIICLLVCVPLALFATGRNQTGTTASGAGQLAYGEIDWYTRINTQPDGEMVFSAASDYIQSKLNTKVNFISMAYEDWLSRFPVILNSGSARGILYFGNENPYLTGINMGILQPIENLLDQYAPATKALFKNEVWDSMRVNGHIYGVPTLKDNSYIMSAYYNSTMAERLGIDMSNVKWKSYVEMEPILMEVKQKRDAMWPEQRNHPLIYNSSDPFPYHFRLEVLTGNTPLAALNVPGIMDISGYNTDTVFNLYETREFLNYARTMARLNTAEIISIGTTRPGDFSQTDGQYFIATTWGTVVFPETYFGASVVSKGIPPEKVWTSTSNYQSAGSGISANYNDPVRAMRVLDLMNTDPHLATMMRFGIEGQHYVYNAAGRMTLEGSPRNSDASARGYLNWYGAWIGNLTIVNTPQSHGGVDNALMRTLNDYNNSAALGHMGFIFDQSPVEPVVAACTAVVNEYNETLRLGLLPESNVEAYIAEFTAKLRANGVQRIIDEAQRQLNAWRTARR